MRRFYTIFLVLVFSLSACGQVVSTPATLTETASQIPLDLDTDSSQPISERAEDLLGQMTLQERLPAVGEMKQIRE